MKLLVLQIICAYTYLALSQENIPKNEAFLLSSVYDAMRNNLQANLRNNLNKNDVLMDLRNKRNVNERTDYGYNNNNGYAQDDYKPTEEEEWPVKSASEICTSIIPKQINTYSKITFTDAINSIGNGLAIIAKVLLTVIAITALPLMLFTAFILPFKVLMGIKTMAVANSLLVGSLLYRHYHQDDDDDTTDAATLTNSATDNKVAVVNGAVPVAIEDYNEIGEQEANRILRFVNKKNKDW